ncbi:MAG: hypothetical protein WBD20_02615 [Pirellulaceae bacterium]
MPFKLAGETPIFLIINCPSKKVAITLRVMATFRDRNAFILHLIGQIDLKSRMSVEKNDHASSDTIDATMGMLPALINFATTFDGELYWNADLFFNQTLPVSIDRNRVPLVHHVRRR